MIKKRVLKELESVSFPTNKSRTNVATSSQSFVMGDVNYKGQAYLKHQTTRGPSRWNKKFPELHLLLQELIQFYQPGYEYTTIQVNKNVECLPHVDKNNVGMSYVIALGDFTGGELVIENKPYNIKNRFKLIDGRLGHWTNPFAGDRYCLVYFTHTFTAPNTLLRHVKITKEGYYNKDVLVKKYK